MNRLTLLILAVSVAVAAPAVQAEPMTREQVRLELAQAKNAGLVTYGELDYPPSPPAAASKTRAQVRADLALWKRSGMADLYRGSQKPDVFSLKYRQRHAEYVRMRTGAEYLRQLEIENGRQ
ncbi:DUF4148 domain-containing protein [Achromobacter aegrifaciens]|uniref:DUF4148 domain-containing protein n=1 Tax=Achromobacter aegrifaciens TaxID=1287736 RepID=UPI0027B9CE76|nr:DUF4148 domain-containing protein [Achromobacter aegrifaciens]WLW63550.1 DUF4148 domain-containing protein [Achromobacter aegrifaciens]